MSAQILYIISIIPALLLRVEGGNSSSLCQSLGEFLDTMMEVARSEETVCQLAGPLWFVTRVDFEEGCLGSSVEEDEEIQ